MGEVENIGPATKRNLIVDLPAGSYQVAKIQNEYIQHVGSGLYACPPDVRPGQYRGQSLFS